MSNFWSEELITDYLDDRLSQAEREQVEAHLKSNPGDAETMQEFQQMRLALRSAPKFELDGGFSARVIQAISASELSTDDIAAGEISTVASQLNPTANKPTTGMPATPASSASSAPSSNWRTIAIAVSSLAATLLLAVFLLPRLTTTDNVAAVGKNEIAPSDSSNEESDAAPGSGQSSAPAMAPSISSGADAEPGTAKDKDDDELVGGDQSEEQSRELKQKAGKQKDTFLKKSKSKENDAGSMADSPTEKRDSTEGAAEDSEEGFAKKSKGTRSGATTEKSADSDQSGAMDPSDELKSDRKQSNRRSMRAPESAAPMGDAANEIAGESANDSENDSENDSDERLEYRTGNVLVVRVENQQALLGLESTLGRPAEPIVERKAEPLMETESAAAEADSNPSVSREDQMKGQVDTEFGGAGAGGGRQLNESRSRQKGQSRVPTRQPDGFDQGMENGADQTRDASKGEMKREALDDEFKSLALDRTLVYEVTATPDEFQQIVNQIEGQSTVLSGSRQQALVERLKELDYGKVVLPNDADDAADTKITFDDQVDAESAAMDSDTRESATTTNENTELNEAIEAGPLVMRLSPGSFELTDTVAQASAGETRSGEQNDEQPAMDSDVDSSPKSDEVSGHSEFRTDKNSDNSNSQPRQQTGAVDPFETLPSFQPNGVQPRSQTLVQSKRRKYLLVIKIDKVGSSNRAEAESAGPPAESDTNSDK